MFNANYKNNIISALLRCTLLFLVFLQSYFVYGQGNMLQKSIYFESAKFELTAESKIILDHLADSIKVLQNYQIFIKGNTDNVGDSIFNQQLSLQRVNTTQQYFINKGVSAAVFSTVALGAKNPIADNTTEAGKQKNRRVDIIISFNKTIDNSQTSTSSITNLYKSMARKPQEFYINPKRDTTLRCEKGTIIYIKAYSFINPSPCQTSYITFKVLESFLKSEMILDNLTTTSNKLIIETQGMIYTEANDCNGKKLNLATGKQLVMTVPTDEIVPNTKIFQGNQNPSDGIMNWTLSTNSTLKSFSLANLNMCADYLCGGLRKCPFFFCQIKRFFDRLFGKEATNTNIITPDIALTCGVLEELCRYYGITNIADYIEVVNQPLLDRFNVKTVAELRDTLRKLNLQKLELSYLNKSVSYEDFNYYIYNTSRLGWENVDVFIKEDIKTSITLKVNLKPGENVDCKLVFKNRRFVLPAYKEKGVYIFAKIPKNEAVWVVATKYDNGMPYLSMQEMTTADKTVEVDFQSLTLEELKEKLKVLN